MNGRRHEGQIDDWHVLDVVRRRHILYGCGCRCKTEHILKDQMYLLQDSDSIKTPKGVYLQVHENGF